MPLQLHTIIDESISTDIENFDVLNYLAIEILEHLSYHTPTEEEIDRVEKLIISSLEKIKNKIKNA